MRWSLGLEASKPSTERAQADRAVVVAEGERLLGEVVAAVGAEHAHRRPATVTEVGEPPRGGADGAEAHRARVEPAGPEDAQDERPVDLGRGRFASEGSCEALAQALGRRSRVGQGPVQPDGGEEVVRVRLGIEVGRAPRLLVDHRKAAGGGESSPGPSPTPGSGEPGRRARRRRRPEAGAEASRRRARCRRRRGPRRRRRVAAAAGVSPPPGPSPSPGPRRRRAPRRCRPVVGAGVLAALGGVFALGGLVAVGGRVGSAGSSPASPSSPLSRRRPRALPRRPLRRSDLGALSSSSAPATTSPAPAEKAAPPKNSVAKARLVASRRLLQVARGRARRSRAVCAPALVRLGVRRLRRRLVAPERPERPAGQCEQDERRDVPPRLLLVWH